MSTEQLAQALRMASRLSGGMCGLQEQREAAAVMLRLHALVTTYEADKIQCTPAAPAAMPAAVLVDDEPL